MTKNTIGDKLKQLRTQNNVTQEELAKFLNIKRETVHKYENNIIKNIKYETVAKLAKFLKTTPEYLLGLDEKENNFTSLTKEELVNANMLFYQNKDISDKDKDELFKKIQEIYLKERLK